MTSSTNPKHNMSPLDWTNYAFVVLRRGHSLLVFEERGLCHLSSFHGAIGCIDGETLIYSGGCHTNKDAAPWIAIDYGTRVIVERVEIFNRDNGSGARTRNVDVRISDELPTSGDQMFSGGTLLGHFAGPATNGQHIIISGQKLL